MALLKLRKVLPLGGLHGYVIRSRNVVSHNRTFHYPGSKSSE